MMRKPPKSPIVHRLNARRCAQRQPSNRTSSVDGMLGGVVVAVVAGVYALLTWGAP